MEKSLSKTPSLQTSFIVGLVAFIRLLFSDHLLLYLSHYFECRDALTCCNDTYLNESKSWVWTLLTLKGCHLGCIVGGKTKGPSLSGSGAKSDPFQILIQSIFQFRLWKKCVLVSRLLITFALISAGVSEAEWCMETYWHFSPVIKFQCSGLQEMRENPI